MRTKFKVRDRVKLSEVGKNRWKDTESNPTDCAGTITRISGDWIAVDWDNGTANAYNHDSHLIRA